LTSFGFLTRAGFLADLAAGSTALTPAAPSTDALGTPATRPRGAVVGSTARAAVVVAVVVAVAAEAGVIAPSTSAAEPSTRAAGRRRRRAAEVTWGVIGIVGRTRESARPIPVADVRSGRFLRFAALPGADLRLPVRPHEPTHGRDERVARLLAREPAEGGLAARRPEERRGGRGRVSRRRPRHPPY